MLPAGVKPQSLTTVRSRKIVAVCSKGQFDLKGNYAVRQFRRSRAKIAKSDPAHRDALVCLGLQQPKLTYSGVALCYRTEFDAMPTVDGSLRIAVAHVTYNCWVQRTTVRANSMSREIQAKVVYLLLFKN
jgi:hypothetical protein